MGRSGPGSLIGAAPDEAVTAPLCLGCSTRAPARACRNRSVSGSQRDAGTRPAAEPLPERGERIGPSDVRSDVTAEKEGNAMPATIDPATTKRSLPVGLRAEGKPREWWLHWILRIAVASTFIGHGAFGIRGKEAWLEYYAIFGISREELDRRWAGRLLDRPAPPRPSLSGARPSAGHRSSGLAARLAVARALVCVCRFGRSRGRIQQRRPL